MTRSNWKLTTTCSHCGVNHYHFEKFSDAVNSAQERLNFGHQIRLEEGLDNRFGTFPVLDLQPGMDVRLALQMREGD